MLSTFLQALQRKREAQISILYSSLEFFPSTVFTVKMSFYGIFTTTVLFCHPSTSPFSPSPPRTSVPTLPYYESKGKEERCILYTDV